jgi:Excalibur calcium-binding domain
VTWQQQDPKRSERWLSAGLIVAFVLILGGLAWVISNRSAPDGGEQATDTTKVQPSTTVRPPSTASPKTTTLASTTTVATTTTLPSTTTTTTTTLPSTTTTVAPAGPVRAQPDGLFCRDLKARGYGFRQALGYWIANGRPARMDADGNGVPCETVYPAEEIALVRAARR